MIEFKLPSGKKISVIRKNVCCFMQDSIDDPRYTQIHFIAGKTVTVAHLYDEVAKMLAEPKDQAENG